MLIIKAINFLVNNCDFNKVTLCVDRDKMKECRYSFDNVLNAYIIFTIRDIPDKFNNDEFFNMFPSYNKIPIDEFRDVFPSFQRILYKKGYYLLVDDNDQIVLHIGKPINYDSFSNGNILSKLPQYKF